MVEEHRGVWSRLHDGVVARVPTPRWTEHADDGGSCISFLLFHTTVHADYAVRAVVRGAEPLLVSWRHRLGLDAIAPDRGVGEAEDAGVVAALDAEALLHYAQAVHADTQAWLAEADLGRFDDVPPASQRLSRYGGVDPEALGWLRTMWADKAVWWHVQWEGTGHLLNHVGEMVAVRNRMGLSPF
jgi:hypothetical protein